MKTCGNFQFIVCLLKFLIIWQEFFYFIFSNVLIFNWTITLKLAFSNFANQWWLHWTNWSTSTFRLRICWCVKFTDWNICQNLSWKDRILLCDVCLQVIPWRHEKLLLKCLATSISTISNDGHPVGSTSFLFSLSFFPWIHPQFFHFNQFFPQHWNFPFSVLDRLNNFFLSSLPTDIEKRFAVSGNYEILSEIMRRIIHIKLTPVINKEKCQQLQNNVIIII